MHTIDILKPVFSFEDFNNSVLVVPSHRMYRLRTLMEMIRIER